MGWGPIGCVQTEFRVVLALFLALFWVCPLGFALALRFLGCVQAAPPWRPPEIIGPREAQLDSLDIVFLYRPRGVRLVGLSFLWLAAHFPAQTGRRLCRLGPQASNSPTPGHRRRKPASGWTRTGARSLNTARRASWPWTELGLQSKKNTYPHRRKRTFPVAECRNQRRPGPQTNNPPLLDSGGAKCPVWVR